MDGQKKKQERKKEALEPLVVCCLIAVLRLVLLFGCSSPSLLVFTVQIQMMSPCHLASLPCGCCQLSAGNASKADEVIGNVVREIVDQN